MKYNVLILTFILLTVFLNAQDGADNGDKDKYTAQNYLVSRIIDTPLGKIVEYYPDGSFEGKMLYLPSKFFNDGSAVVVNETNTNISPQMNVIFKNGKPFRAKLYINPTASDARNKYIEVLSNSIREGFQTEELVIDME